ncbi:hypothetical protein BGZ51_007309 [Haplosporangium sp. Z 767]|nr:hypothetical protein BGZ50_002484 [Haplosporangium sp. Z 11]KAF9191453.1 hypothetical protein BGZ51_007309 [Haplosporangium sp. Z 767]
MHRLLNGGRPAANMNKPLPEPLVDPDEGKTPIGELVIVPIQGKDLPNRERFGKQDPFILFKLGNVSKRSTTDVRGGQRPIWKDDQINIFMYESDAKDAKSLYVTCLDEDPKKNDLIGDCVINLAKVLEQGEHDDWFELSYKGREAGELLLQLTYYSHDPKHPTNRMNRPKASETTTGGSARRPIHPIKEPKKHKEEPAAEDGGADEGPVYKPPVVPEASVYQEPAVPVQTPMVSASAYPYGVHPAGGIPGAPRPVSPSSQNHYVGHHTPQIPPVNPYGPPAATPAHPYAAAATNTGFPGYPAAAGPYPDPNLGQDPSKRLSVTGQSPQPGAFAPAAFPGNQGYPPQGVPGQQGGYPPQNGGFQPQGNTMFPPNNNVGGSSPFPVAQPLPLHQGVNNNSSNNNTNGPPAVYPFAASNMYPINNNNNNNNGNMNNNNPGFPNQPNAQGYPQAGPGFHGPPGNNNFNNGPYNSHGGINNHSNGNLNNMNSNNGFNNNNNNGGFNNNNNNNNFNSNGSGFNNNNNNNNFNGGKNFNNNGGNFNGNNGGNFNNNNGGNFNNNNNGGNFNNNGNNYNNNNFNNNQSGGSGGYSSGTPKKHFSPTPIVATPVQRPAESMYRPDEF